MLWLIIIISAYFLMALSALGDDYLLAGPPNPKSYSFYTGTLAILVVLLIPFVGFSIPNASQIILCLLTGVIFILASFFYFTALEHFEVSRVAPAIGATLPLFTFGLLYFFSGGKSFLRFEEIIAFVLLILGSIFISFEKGKKISLKSLQFTTIAAFLFALTFILSKYIYLQLPFWTGFIWMRIGGFVAALCFLFTKEIRKEIFQKKFTFQKKTGTFFLGNQVVGAGAFILQNWAIALVPITFLPFINALEGTKYVFLLIFAVLLAVKFPQFLKEKISKEIIFQKIFATLLIIGGLILFYFK